MSNTSEISTTPPAQPIHSAITPPSQWGINLYGIFLLALVVGYFALMFFLAGELLQWAYVCIRHMASGSAFSIALYGLAALILSFYLIRTVRHLIYAFWGLVTPLHDSVPEAEEGIEVTRGDYPKLFQVIDDVGKAVAAPSPDEVRIHYGPEPGTFEMRQFGISTQRRLVMLLSLPQMGVLSDKEFGVILAHELSHFGCGYTRLVVFLERFVNGLRNSVEQAHLRWWHWVDPIYWLQYAYLRFLILLCAPMQQRQEFRADSISAQLYGGDVAAHTLLKNWLLGNQFLTAISSYEPSPNGDEADNVFAWFRSRLRDFTPDGEDYLLRRLESLQQASMWNDDPTIAQRVALMRTFPSRGMEDKVPIRDVVESLEPLEEQLHEILLADE